MIPDRRSGHDLENASFVTIPVGHRQLGPALLLFFEEFGELGQPAALFAWSSVLAGAAFWRRLEQTGGGENGAKSIWRRLIMRRDALKVNIRLGAINA